MNVLILFLPFMLLWQNNLVYSAAILEAEHKTEVCETEDCLKTANQILKWLDPKINPCDDFYEFACGNWRNLPEEERSNKSQGARDKIEERFLPEILKTPSSASATPSFEKLRSFLITCMDEDGLERIGVTPLVSLIEKAGGWPVLDPDWSEENWDFTEMETVLGGVLIDIESRKPFFFEDKYENSSYYLMVGQGFTSRKYTPDVKILQEGLKNDSVKDYYNRLVDVAVVLGADREAAEAAMKEVLEFETAFTKAVENIYHDETYSGPIEVNLEDFYNTAPNVNLKELLAKQLPASYELLPDRKIEAYVHYLKILDKFFNQYPVRTLANYIVSKAVYPLMKYVTQPLNLTIEENNYSSLNIKKKKSRLDFCITTATESSLGPAVTSYIAIFYKTASKVAADITQIIKEELAKEVEEIKWFDEQTRSEVAKNISELEINVGFPPLSSDLKKLEEIYVDHEMDTSSFFDAIIYDMRWKKQKELEKLLLNSTKDTADWKSWKIKISAHFSPTSNSIRVSGAMLYYLPLFSPGSPAYVNYGHIGIVIAHELIHALDINADPFKYDRKFMQEMPDMERWADNKTESIYNEKKQCFVNFYSSINDTKLTNLKLNGNYTVREDMADNGGLKLSLRAYRRLADQLGSPEQKLPQLEQYTAEQLFMISVANVFCEIPYKQKRMKQLSWSPHSPGEFRINGMVMNSFDFSEIFNCKKNEPMNPTDKCKVW